MILPDKTDETSLELRDRISSSLGKPWNSDSIPPPVKHRGCSNLERPLPLFDVVTLCMWLSVENTSKITISQQADSRYRSRLTFIGHVHHRQGRTVLSASLWGRKLTLSREETEGGAERFNKLAWSHKTSRLQRWDKSLEGVAPELKAGLCPPGAGKFSPS